jgi:hypothetical protein
MELFAQFNQNANPAAFRAGLVIGIIIAVVVCGSIPLVLGLSRGQPVIGVIGALITAVTSGLFGCLGGLPMASVFVVIVLVMGKPAKKKGKKRRRSEWEDDDDEDEREYEEYDEEEDRRRRRNRRDE